MSTGARELDPADVAAHYDDLDRFYRAFWGEHVHHGLWITGSETPEEATLQLVEAVAKEARLQPGGDVCDIGCGYGATARLIAREFNANVIGLTISANQHRHALAITPAAANPTYLLQDWLKNDLPASSFDVAIAIESTEHMPDLSAFFRQAERVLRPGGRLVVCAWLTRENPRPAETRWLIDPICREGRLRAMENVATHQRAAQESGLKPDGFTDLTRQVQKTWPICAGRVAKGFFREPEYRRFLLRDGGPNRVFALTLLRIIAAYRLQSMRYGILAFSKQ